MPKFIKTELKSDSDSDLDSDLEKMEAKIDNELEPSSDNVLYMIPRSNFFG